MIGDGTPAPLLRPPLWLAGFALAQVAIQAIAVVPGLAVVRLVDVSGYALYTLAFAVEAVLAILAEVGTGSVLSGKGGAVCGDPQRFGALVRAAVRFRSRFSGALLLMAMPLTVWLLQSRGATLPVALAAAAAVGISFWLRMRAAALMTVPRLLLDSATIQRTELAGAVARLLFVVAGALLFRHWLAALAFGIAGPLVQERLLAAFTARKLALGGAEHAEDVPSMRAAVRRELLNGLYYAFQGQLAVWLIGLHGSVEEIAALGALSRLTIVFVPLTTTIANVVLPRVARVSTPAELWQRWWQLQIGVLGIGLTAIAAAFLLPGPILWVLGGGYAHLHAELLWMTACSVWHVIVGVSWSFNAARGWTRSSWIYVPVTLALQAALVPVLPLHRLDGVLLFGAISQVPLLVLSLWLTYRGARSMRPSVDPAVAA